MSVFSCKKDNNEIDDVTFDAEFLGARLDSVSSKGNNKYVAYINPAFEPVNKSPWFAFGVSTKSEKEIVIELNYGNYKHRYIPKLSTDRISWENINEDAIEIDLDTEIASLRLNISSRKIYVAAQEIESSVIHILGWIIFLRKTQ